MIKKKDLLSQVIETMPRLLTQLDRDPLSPTYGCFDRNYWHYRIRDFSSMVLQQNILSLALVYKNKFSGNVYYQSDLIHQYILASLKFWQKAQHQNGSFDEYWPNECGYPPLVFSTHAVLKTIILLKLDENEYKKPLSKAIKQIAKNKEENASNQEAAGVVCLYLYNKLYKDQLIEKTFKNRFHELLSKQSSEGWFPEYGGADIGYSSVFLNYLSELIDTQYQKKVLSALKNQLSFLKNFIHPDGSLGGEYGSRNTEYFLLAGLVRMRKYSQDANEMLAKINWTLNSLDDRYLFHYIFHSFVEGAINFSKLTNIKQNKQSFEKYYPESGLYVKRNNKIHFIANLKKGGVYKLFVNNKIKSQCGGYRIKNNNHYLVTNWLSSKADINQTAKSISTTVPLHINRFTPITPIKHILLRIIALAPFKKTIINLLKNMLINQNLSSQTFFTRKFTFAKNKLIITDGFNSNKDLIAVESIEASMRFVPSSKFFQEQTTQLKTNTKTINFKVDDQFKQIFQL